MSQVGTGRESFIPAPVSAVVPEYRSAASLHPLVNRLEEALAGRELKIIHVDEVSPAPVCQCTPAIKMAYP